MPDYVKIFDPPLVPPHAVQEHVGDRAAASAYVYDEDLVLAVNVALATRRPLLLRGLPGTGKSSLARNVAMHLNRRFYPHTISSRTQARDLLWTVDDVARLSDANTRGAKDRSHYVVPGPLWWAFDPAGAADRGLPDVPGTDKLDDPNEGSPDAQQAVVLLDEIDKADPDVPNDLLEPLGLYQFRNERGRIVRAAAAPLVVLTTNEERDLPKAFLRRCVVYMLPTPTQERLVDIAAVHLGQPDVDLYSEIATWALRAATTNRDGEPPAVSTAEFLDAVTAARTLDIRPGHSQWPDVLAATTSKQ